MNVTPETRRHDLDALRALAMLLGILLHALMTFVPGLWPVQDSSANAMVGVVVVLIHGFRMPLFFLVSGFFTALLWRRYGLKGVIRHRLLRILLPCVLGVLTIVPLYRFVVQATVTAPAVSIVSPPARTLVEAVQRGSIEQARKLLAAGAERNSPDSKFGGTPLSSAAMRGEVEMVQLLLEKGANASQPNADKSTPLNCAAFLGQDVIVAILIKNGADVHARTQRGDNPTDATYADGATIQQIVGILGLPARSQEDIEAGQKRCRALLPATVRQTEPLLTRVRNRYGAFLKAPYFATPVFEHLWFLWFLVWLLPFFALWTRFADRIKISSRWTVSPLRYLWVIPVTMVPQTLMGTQMPSFGPDTATGIVPPPHLLAYYGVFFFFGALYYEAGDTVGVLGKRWWLTLSLALGVFLPLGIMTMSLPATMTASIQASYTWLMVFGCMGLARRFMSTENPTMRYLSDSSYWLYIAHLPLIVALQLLVRDLPLPLLVKLLIILGVSVIALLASYQLFVRYTVLGVLLNGKKATKA